MFSNFSQVFVQELVLILFRFTAGRISWRSDFQESQTLSVKRALLDTLKELIFIHLMTFAVTQETVHKPICVMNTSISPSKFIRHPCWSVLFHCLILHDFACAYLSESHTSLSSFHSFYLTNKTIQFPFLRLHYPALFSIHTVSTEAFSSIVLPIIFTNSCSLMWDSLRPTFQQVFPHQPQHLIWDID